MRGKKIIGIGCYRLESRLSDMQNNKLCLEKNTINIWSANLTHLAQHEAICLALLSPDELARANRYKVGKAKSTFVLARGILRYLLARYLSIAPEKITFDYTAHKKPFLASIHQSNLSFSMTHSGEMALFAFGYDREIGVDIEKIGSHDYEEIAKRFFTETESERLLSLSDDKRAVFFYQLWTRKEAVLKAMGLGLTVPLNQVEVLDQDQPIYIAQKEWFYQTLFVDQLQLPVNYQVAIASDKPLTQLYCLWIDNFAAFL